MEEEGRREGADRLSRLRGWASSNPSLTQHSRSLRPGARQDVAVG